MTALPSIGLENLVAWPAPRENTPIQSLAQLFSLLSPSHLHLTSSLVSSAPPHMENSELASYSQERGVDVGL